MRKTEMIMQNHGYKKEEVSEVCYTKKVDSNFEFVILLDGKKSVLSSYIKLKEAIVKTEEQEIFAQMLQNIKTDVQKIMEALTCTQ